MALLDSATSPSNLFNEQQELCAVGPQSTDCNNFDPALPLESRCSMTKSDDCCAKAPATASVAFTPGDFGDLLCLGNESTDATEEELLHDLEQFFGDVECDWSDEGKFSSSDCSASADAFESSAAAEARCRGAEGLDEEGESGLLIDADLQDALLVLPEDLLAEANEDLNGEKQEDDFGSELTAALSDISDIPALDFDGASPLLPSPLAGACPSPIRHQTEQANALAGAAAGDAPAAGVEEAGCEDLAGEAEAAATESTTPAAEDASVVDAEVSQAAIGSTAADGVEETAVQASGAGDESRVDTENAYNGDGDVNVDNDGRRAVPTHLLDAVDLWESANANKGRGRKGSLGKKKKNKFGKRRRSSGGGGGGSPQVPGGVAPARTSSGRGRKVKVDPLAAVKEVRALSRKPLIVQWLKSDGCESDAEAESVVVAAVGSLDRIYSHYWGGGG